MKKVTAILLSMLMLLSVVVPFTAFAEGEEPEWSTLSHSTYAECIDAAAEGTDWTYDAETKQFDVYTADGWCKVVDLLNSDGKGKALYPNGHTVYSAIGGKLVLHADLKFVDAEDQIVPVGGINELQKYEIDGQGHTLHSMRINKSFLHQVYTSGKYFGLVGIGRKLTIRDLIIDNACIGLKDNGSNGSCRFIGLVGEGNSVTAINLTLKNSTISGDIYVGGIIGGETDNAGYENRFIDCKVINNRFITAGLSGCYGGLLRHVSKGDLINCVSEGNYAPHIYSASKYVTFSGPVKDEYDPGQTPIAGYWPYDEMPESVFYNYSGKYYMLLLDDSWPLIMVPYANVSPVNNPGCYFYYNSLPRGLVKDINQTLTYHEPVASTCVTQGHIGYWATENDLPYLDAEGHQPVEPEDVLLPLDPTNHEGPFSEPADAVDVSCQNDGFSGVITCEACGEVSDPGHVVDQLSHEPSEPAGYTPATCTEDGFSGVITCGVGGEILDPGHVIPALGHEWGKWTVTTPVSYGVDGEEDRVCARCGEKETRVISVANMTGRKIQFTKMDDMYYVVHMGSHDRWILKEDTRAFDWYDEVELNFEVRLGLGWRLSDYSYKTYVIYLNNKPLEPNEDGTYTIPANIGRAVVTITGASEPTADETPTQFEGKISFWEKIVNFFKMIAETLKNLFK